jgi:carboxymethylenebutenolidase
MIVPPESMRHAMDRRILELYDEYTHAPLPRRVFLERLAAIAGSSAAAMAILPLLDSNYAHAAVAENDARLSIGSASWRGPSGEIRGYLVVPQSGPAKRPAVIVIHENRGLTPYIRDVARRLALEGFTSLAPDLLSPHGGTPADEDKGRELFAARVDRERAAHDVLPAIALLEARSDAAGGVGAIGFCFGGQVVNQLATIAPSLDAAVPFYGRQPPLADVPKIRARIQIHYAGNDPGINAGMAAYEAALKAAGVRYEQYVYDGAEHAFHNDTSAARYNKAAADLAWSRTVTFLRSALSPA